MRILYTTNNMVQPYCRKVYIIPLLIIFLIMLIVSTYYINNDSIIGVICIIIMAASFISIIVFVGYESKQGYKYYVVLEENEQIDLTKYNIEEQKGDLYIITDK